jgi:hypothetical protein
MLVGTSLLEVKTRGRLNPDPRGTFFTGLDFGCMLPKCNSWEKSIPVPNFTVTNFNAQTDRAIRETIYGIIYLPIQ